MRTCDEVTVLVYVSRRCGPAASAHAAATSQATTHAVKVYRLLLHAFLREFISRWCYLQVCMCYVGLYYCCFLPRFGDAAILVFIFQRKSIVEVLYSMCARRFVPGAWQRKLGSVNDLSIPFRPSKIDYPLPPLLFGPPGHILLPKRSCN